MNSIKKRNKSFIRRQNEIKSSQVDEEVAAIDHHLKKALEHLKKSVILSIDSLQRKVKTKEQVGHLWEEFLRSFFGYIKRKGKESKINLLSIISFSKSLK